MTTTASRMDRAAILSASEAVGEGVHVAVLDDRLVDDQRQHRRGGGELPGCSRCCRRPWPATSSRPLTLPSMSRQALISASSRTATISAATSPMISASVHGSVVAHLPTATFRSGARGVQDAHAGVVDAVDAGQAVGLLAHLVDAADGAGALDSAIRCASRTIVMTIAAATRMTTIPRISPIVQPRGRCQRGLHLTPPPLVDLARREYSFREHADDVSLVFLGPTLVGDRLARRRRELRRRAANALARRAPPTSACSAVGHVMSPPTAASAMPARRDRAVFVDVQRGARPPRPPSRPRAGRPSA